MSQAAVYSQDFIPPLIRLFSRMSRWPLGQVLFAKALCFKAPYFSSIKPYVDTLEPGRVIWKIKNRRRVHNHLGTVHALAMEIWRNYVRVRQWK